MTFIDSYRIHLAQVLMHDADWLVRTFEPQRIEAYKRLKAIFAGDRFLCRD